MSVRAPVGRLNLATGKIVIGRGLCAIQSKSGRQALLYQQLKDRFREEDTMGSGTIFKAVTKRDVEALKLLNCHEQLAEEFEKLVNPLFQQLEILWRTNRNLRTTRDILLPKLISGEISVKAADEMPTEPELVETLA